MLGLTYHHRSDKAFPSKAPKLRERFDVVEFEREFGGPLGARRAEGLLVHLHVVVQHFAEIFGARRLNESFWQEAIETAFSSVGKDGK
jgi:hypothetical protein